jgi:hypothetical protein
MAQKNEKRVSVYIPVDLYDELTKLKKINRSRICRFALEQAVNEHNGRETETPSTTDALARMPVLERDLRNMRGVLGRIAREAAAHADLVVMTKDEVRLLNEELTELKRLVTEQTRANREAALRQEATAPADVSSTRPHRAGEPLTCGRCEHLLFEDMLCHQPDSANHREERSPDDAACAEFDRKCKNCGHWGSVHGKRRDDVLGSWMFCNGGGPDEDGEGTPCDCTASPCEVFGACVCDSEHCSVFTNAVIAENEEEDEEGDRPEDIGLRPFEPVRPVSEPYKEATPPKVVARKTYQDGPARPILTRDEGPEVLAWPEGVTFLEDDAELQWLLPDLTFKEIWAGQRESFVAPIAGRPIKTGGLMTLRELPVEGGSGATQRRIVVTIGDARPAPIYNDSEQVAFDFTVVECMAEVPCSNPTCELPADTDCSKCGAPLCWLCWAGNSGVGEPPLATCQSCLDKPQQPAAE